MYLCAVSVGHCQPGVRCSLLAPDGKLIEYYYEDAKTTYEAFVRGLKQSSELFVNTPGLSFRKCPIARG